MKPRNQFLFILLTLILVVALIVPASYARGRNNKAATPTEQTNMNKGQNKIDVKDLPAEIRDGIKSAYPNADIKEAFRVNEGNGMVYRVKISDNNVDRFLMYTPGGQLNEVDQKIDKDQIPATIKTSLDRDYPNPDIEKVQKVVKNGITTWEVLLTQNGQHMMVTYDDSGNRLSAQPESKGSKDFDMDKDKD